MAVTSGLVMIVVVCPMMFRVGRGTVASPIASHQRTGTFSAADLAWTLLDRRDSRSGQVTSTASWSQSRPALHNTLYCFRNDVV